MSELKQAIANHYMMNSEEALKKSTRNISVRVNVDVLSRVDFLARKLGLNRSQMVQLLLDEGSADGLFELSKIEAGENGDQRQIHVAYIQECCNLEVTYDAQSDTDEVTK